MKPTLAIAATLLLGACTAQVSGSYPSAPPLPAEAMPLPPVSEQALIWRPGDWIFVDGSYRYDPGRYEPAAGHGTLWTRGHWEGTAGHYGWVPGHWS